MGVSRCCVEAAVVDVCGVCNDMYEHLWDFGYYTTAFIL
jgi:hypothetical protein